MTGQRNPLPSARDAEAAVWCLTLAEGEFDAGEKEAFDAWIADAANDAALSDALRVWQAADAAADLPEMIGVRTGALTRFRQAQRRRWSRPFSRPWTWVAAAAAGLLLALLATSLLMPTTQIYQTGVGERQVAVLADGSRLSLDADTEVRVTFRDERRDLVLSRGRAKFDVARDPLRPFSVMAGEKIVVATGTSFSVELLHREARVLLYEGHVAVMNKPRTDLGPVKQGSANTTRSDAFTALVPGRELVTAFGVAPDKARILDTDLARSLSWEAGQMNFEDVSLGAAAERVNRYSHRKVVLSDPSLENLVVNGVFVAGDIDAFVESIAAFNAVRVEDRGETVILRPS